MNNKFNSLIGGHTYDLHIELEVYNSNLKR